jgi:hypothetical protein
MSTTTRIEATWKALKVIYRVIICLMTYLMLIAVLIL